MELTPDVQQQLVAPFDIGLVEIKPGATTKDKAKALALAYADSRAYQDRLDAVVGAANWEVRYRMVSVKALVCRLTICGVTKEDLGECADSDDPNFWTVASAQAFKRACAAFGIGRYFYSLPQPWAEFDAQRKQFTDPRRVIEKMYHQAGLPVGQRPAPARQPAPVATNGGDPERADLVQKLARQKNCKPSAFDNVPLDKLRSMVA
jgi:hypothetical protein